MHKPLPLVSWRAALIYGAVFILLVPFLARMPLAPLNLGSFTLFAAPFLLLLCLAAAGYVPAFFCMAVLLAGIYGAGGGTPAMALGLVYLAPVLAAFALCQSRQETHWRTAAIVFFTYLASVLLIHLLLQKYLGGDYVQSGALAAQRAMEGIPQRDQVLYLLWKSNFLQLDASFGERIFDEQGSQWAFTPAVLTEFYQQIRLRASLWLGALLPTLLSSYGIYLSLLGSSAAVELSAPALGPKATTQAQPLPPGSGWPHFSQWYLPRQAARFLWLLALGYFLARAQASPLLSLAGGMMYNVFSAIYVIQGLSTLDHWQVKRGLRPWLRWIFLALAFLLLQPLLLMVGLFDQLADPRHLRGPSGNAVP